MVRRCDGRATIEVWKSPAITKIMMDGTEVVKYLISAGAAHWRFFLPKKNHRRCDGLYDPRHFYINICTYY
jgi:hypothetical protein